MTAPTAEADALLLADVNEVVWGTVADVPADIANRWCNQGFVFSSSEPSALHQNSGGPCGVLAPVQGFIFRHLLFSGEDDPTTWRQRPDYSYPLVSALSDIINKARLNEEAPLVVCTLRAIDPSSDAAAAGPSVQDFLARLEICRLESNYDAVGSLFSVLDSFQGNYGVLLFLYSVLLTRGPDAIRADQGVQIEPLISSPFGHATQSMVNLVLTGAATANVWDGVRDADGLPLAGVASRAQVGMLSLLEALRLCSVGANLKTPQWPVWVLASESHYTVLFSPDARLTQETNMERALRLFAARDKEGGGYLSPDDALAVLRELYPAGTNAYLSQLLRDMEAEIMGVVLRTNFEKILFPKGDEQAVKNFEVFHYNGIAPPGGQVSYCHGFVRLGDFFADDSQSAQCLRTKWPEMQLMWDTAAPKLT